MFRLERFGNQLVMAKLSFYVKDVKPEEKIQTEN